MNHQDHQDRKETVLCGLRGSVVSAWLNSYHKEDRVSFTALIPWPGTLIRAEGRYLEGGAEKRAAIFVGPEFGTVQRADLVEAAREAGDAAFDVLISCAFNYEAHTTEFNEIQSLRNLKNRIFINTLTEKCLNLFQ